MGRNIRIKDEGNIRFNLYGHSIVKGKIIKDDIIKERFYANYVGNYSKSKAIVDGVIRSRGNDAMVVTKSDIKSIEEDDYIENTATKEIWRITRIEQVAINVNSSRPMYERTLYLSK